jgi:hypothetical protein
MTDEEYLSIIREPIFIKPFDELFQDKIKEIQTLVNGGVSSLSIS